MVIRSGRARSAMRFRTVRLMGGNAIWPARSSFSSNPRQTMSRSAPLACFQFQISHNSRDSFQRLTPGRC
jgi:hypothetical protein